MPSLRRHRVALYAYGAAIDADSMGVAVSTYTRVRSAATDGNWWAAFGIRTSAETAPTTNAQHVQTGVWGIDRAITTAHPTLTADGIVVDDAGQRWRITGLEPRRTHGNTIQLLAVTVDDANAGFRLVDDPEPV